MRVLRTAPWRAVGLLWCVAVATAPGVRAARGVDLPVTAAPAPLRAAVEGVWTASPDVQAAGAELDAAGARARAAAQPLYNPSVTAEAEDADVNRRTVGISLPLDLSGKRQARATRGEAELRASAADYDLYRVAIAQRWLTAWSGAALASRQVELGRTRVDLMERFDQLAAQRLAVGDISSPDRDLAALALGDARMQQAALVAAEATARGGLYAIAGDDTGPVPDLPPWLPPAASAIVPVAVAELPAIRGAAARADGAQAGVQVASKARIPDPTLSLTGGEVRVGSVRDQVVGVSISMPIPVRNSGRAEVAAASADADAAAANAQAQRLRSHAALVEARTRYAALREAAVALRSGRAAAFDERTALLEKLWRAGEISTSDYLIQVRESLDTALAGLELERQLWQAWFDYLGAAGRLVDWIEGRTQEMPR